MSYYLDKCFYSVEIIVNEIREILWLIIYLSYIRNSHQHQTLMP